MTIHFRKILIIQTAFLGDVILTTPLVRSLKNLLPDAQIDFLCIPKTSEALLNNPHIHELIIWDKHKKSLFEFSRLLQRIHGSNYDIVLCPHRSVRSAIITQYSDADQRIGFDRNAFSGSLTGIAEYDFHAHEVDRNLSLLKAIEDIEFDETKIIHNPELFASDEDIKYVNELLNKNTDKPFAGIAPCSQWFTKQLPEEKTIEIINRLIGKDFDVLLFGSSSDTGYCSEIETKFSSGVINLCGKLSVTQSYAAMKKCDVMITVDSAATHIASAADTPIITIFGSTVPAYGFTPISHSSKVIGVEGLECRPCTDHGRKKCPLVHFKCMYDIDVEEVVAHLTAIKQG